MVNKMPKFSRLFIYLLLFCLLMLGIYKIVDICVIEHARYVKLYNSTVNQVFSGMSAPRGRILDTNGKVLVDNIGVNTIMFNRVPGITLKDEVNIALALGEILDIDDSLITEYRLKTFYLILHDNCKDLISDGEYKLLSERKLNQSDIKSLKYSRITSDNLKSMSETERKASYIYYALSKGYSYQFKTIIKGISDETIARVAEQNLKGIITTLTWQRYYPYENTLRTIFGNVSMNSVPLEFKDYYLKKGLNLESSVGTSSLEFQYDDYLRGTPARYKIKRDGSIECIEEEKQGYDLYLSIDIALELKLEEILKEEMLNAKKYSSSTYYNHSYVLIGNPLTGEIVAMSGLMYINNHFLDITTNVINSSYTIGSVVKGASMSVGYANDLILRGKNITDSCVKLYGVGEKCSWTRLGAIDDIKAMAQSSNYYQFLIAISLTNQKYKRNMKINVSKEQFDVYRNMFASFGLGTKTFVDLPNEQTGIKGSIISDDLYLNLAIGQYDTYTPMQVFQYVNSVASGKRTAPSLMKKIVDNDKIILENKPKVLNVLPISDDDLIRVQKGFKAVMSSGTGYYYTNKSVTSAGKTGTSETFVDTDNDGLIDTKTITNSFVMYAPFDNPEYSIAIISPNIGNGNGKYQINSHISNKLFKYLFEKA